MEITMNRLLYLLYMYRSGDRDCTVTKMAKLFQVSKSTVSRNMDYFVDQGIVYADSMQLTAYGSKMAARYSEEVDLLEKWVEWTVPGEAEENRENAMQMAVNLTSGMKQRLLQRIRMNQMFKGLSHRGEIAFSEFVQDLPDGSYSVGIIIFREKFQGGKFLSMANKGFSHPAELKISGNTGILQLKAVTMERRNMLDNLVSSGKLLKLDYDQKGEFVPAVKDGDVYQIPAEALEYTFHKEENMLLGNLVIQLYAPLANKKLHTKKAVLSLIVHGGA